MPSPIRIETRREILKELQAGATFAELGKKYRVSAEWVRQFWRRFEMTGEIQPLQPVRRKKTFSQRHETQIREAVTGNPSITLEQLRDHLGVKVSIGTLWYALQDLKVSFKKKRSNRPSRNVPT